MNLDRRLPGQHPDHEVEDEYAARLTRPDMAQADTDDTADDEGEILRPVLRFAALAGGVALTLWLVWGLL